LKIRGIGMPHNFHLHFDFFDLRKELNQIYTSIVFRNLGYAMAGVFVPIFLLKNGYTLNQVIIYFMMYALATSFLAVVAAYSSSKIGLKHTTSIGLFSLMSSFLMLYSFDKYTYPLLLIAVAIASGVVFYWVPINAYFAKVSDGKKRGEQTSYLVAIAKGSGVVGPIFGAYIITLYSFKLLFVLVFLLLLGAYIPLLKKEDYKAKFKFDFKSIFSKKELSFLDFFIFQAMIIGTISFIFPIYVYLFVEDIVAIGGISSFFGASLVLLSLLIGKISDTFDKSTVVRMGGLVLLFAFLLLMFNTSIYYFYGVSFLMGIGFVLVSIPLFSKYCNYIKNKNKLEFMTYREICFGIGYAFTTIMFTVVPVVGFNLLFASSMLCASLLMIMKL